jgi:hypothetical protein
VSAPLPITGERVIKPFPGNTASMPVNSPAKQLGFTIYRSQLNGDSQYAPFASKMDWEIARWAKLQGPSSSAVTELLQIEGVRSWLIRQIGQCFN